jgi:hypothetical protein
MEQRRTPYQHLKVAVSQTGHGTVELDGQEIQDGVAGIELRAHVGELSSVILPEETQAALKQLGWTPPA